MKRSIFDRLCAQIWRYILTVTCILAGLHIGGAIGIIILIIGWGFIWHYIGKSLELAEAVEDASEIIAKQMMAINELSGEKKDENKGSESQA